MTKIQATRLLENCENTCTLCCMSNRQLNCEHCKVQKLEDLANETLNKKNNEDKEFG